jgi:hypothetical protein
MNWQPIETVPWEEYVIISWINENGNRCVGQSILELESIYTGNDFIDGLAGSPRVFWREIINGDILDVKPTHWMPLPEPPK